MSSKLTQFYLRNTFIFYSLKKKKQTGRQRCIHCFYMLNHENIMSTWLLCVNVSLSIYSLYLLHLLERPHIVFYPYLINFSSFLAILVLWGWTVKWTDGPKDGRTDALTDGQTDKVSYRDAWMHLKNTAMNLSSQFYFHRLERLSVAVCNFIHSSLKTIFETF